MSLLIFIIVLLLVCISLLNSCAFFFSMPNSDFKMCLLEHLYHKDCTTTRQSWLFSFYIVINNKQDEMKLENIGNKLQSSFILLQFICLSVLHYTIQICIFNRKNSKLTFSNGSQLVGKRFIANLHASLDSTYKSRISKISTRCQTWGSIPQLFILNSEINLKILPIMGVPVHRPTYTILTL